MEYPLDMFDKYLDFYEIQRIINALIPDFKYDRDSLAAGYEFKNQTKSIVVQSDQGLEVLLEKMHSYIKLYRDYYRLEGGKYIKIPMPKKIKSEFFKPN